LLPPFGHSTTFLTQGPLQGSILALALLKLNKEPVAIKTAVRKREMEFDAFILAGVM
jgi:hypothetical protein